MALERGSRLEERLEAMQQRARQYGRGLQNISESIASHRQSAAECLVYLVDQYGVNEETLVHSLVLLDRYISVAILPDDDSNIQSFISVAVACFMITAKLREVSHPALGDLSRMTSCTCEDLLRSEEIVLQSLDWDVCSVTGSFFSCFLTITEISCPKTAM